MKRFPLKSLSLASFSLIMTLGSILVGSLLTFNVIRGYTFKVIKDLEIEKIVRLGESLRIQTIEELVENRFDKMEKSFELYVKEGLIEGASLLGSDQSPVFFVGKDKDGEIRRFYQTLPQGLKLPKETYYDEREGKYFLFSTMTIEGNILGYLVLIFDLSKIKNLYYSTTKILALLYLLFLLLFIVLWLPLYHRIKNELTEVIKFAKELPFNKGKVLELSSAFTEIKDFIYSINWASLRLRETERELMKEKGVLEAIFSTIDEAIFVVDLDFTIKYHNEQAENFLKKIPLEAEGPKSLKGLFSEGRIKTYPEGKIISLQDLLDRLDWENRAEVQVEVNGSIYELSLSPVSALEEEKDLLLSLKDITEKVRAQEQFLQTEKTRSVVQLAAGIAHDLNNLLAILFNNLNLMYLTKSISQEEQKIYQTLERHLKRARYLAFQLLSLSKGGEIVFEKTDLETVIKDVASFALAGSKVKFYLELKVNVKNLKSDPYALSQVLLNLFINSVQAGAESLRVEVDKTKEDEREYLLVVVSDDGPGIPPEILAKVFEPFFTTKKEGSGLGLYIVKRLVERLGGKLRVESRLGEGTTFYIHLPYETVEEEKLEEGAWALDRRLHILVVDDEEDLRKSLALILEELGHEVITAGDGEEALSTYLSLISQGKNIDLLITDFTMPGRLNGLELIKTLREFTPNLRAILSTGYAEIAGSQDFSKDNYLVILRKPYTLNELIEALNKA